MMSADDNQLTVPEVAARLQMSPDGVYKLIQRGHLDAVRLSARKLRIPASTLDAYLAKEKIEIRRLRGVQGPPDIDAMREDFIKRAYVTPEAWLDAWKHDQIPDTPDNMALLVNAAALRAAAANVPLAHTPHSAPSALSAVNR